MLLMGKSSPNIETFVKSWMCITIFINLLLLGKGLKKIWMV